MSRKLKQQVLEILARQELEEVLTGLAELDPRESIHALFSGICHSEELLRWHAVSAMGPTVARLADADMESGRIVMRRLLWSLNDESGGIGWGAPETMAEIMCHHGGLAREYMHMLVSYIREDGEEPFQNGNFIELAGLQRGVLWGLGRLAAVRGEMLREFPVEDALLPYLSSPDTAVRGLAIRILGLLGVKAAIPFLHDLLHDPAELRLYEDGKLRTVTVADLAAQAKERLHD